MIAFLRKCVLHNFGLKLISLAAAILLWMGVARQRPVAEVAVSVPVEFMHVPEDLENSSETIPPVQIRVRGPAQQLRNLTQSEVHVEVDLARVQPGEHTYDLSSRVHVPRELQVVQVVPTQLRLTFDTRAYKQVPVTPRVIWQLCCRVPHLRNYHRPAAGDHRRAEAAHGRH